MKLKRINLLLVILALTLALILGFGISTSGVALANDAETSGTYGGQNTDNLWYYGPTDLNIEAIREVIIGWNIPARLALDDYLKKNPIIIAVADTGCNLAHEVFDDVLLQNANGEVIKYNSYNAANQRSGVDDVADNAKDYHGTGMTAVMSSFMLLST